MTTSFSPYSRLYLPTWHNNRNILYFKPFTKQYTPYKPIYTYYHHHLWHRNYLAIYPNNNALYCFTPIKLHTPRKLSISSTLLICLSSSQKTKLTKPSIIFNTKYTDILKEQQQIRPFRFEKQLTWFLAE